MWAVGKQKSNSQTVAYEAHSAIMREAARTEGAKVLIAVQFEWEWCRSYCLRKRSCESRTYGILLGAAMGLQRR